MVSLDAHVWSRKVKETVVARTELKCKRMKTKRHSMTPASGNKKKKNPITMQQDSKESMEK